MTPGPAPDPARLAAIHAQAFDAPWSTSELTALMSQPGVLALAEGDDGFILIRTVADEAEILTLAVRPGRRRAGLGAALTRAAAAAARRQGARRLILEVAEDNTAARALYDRAGFIPAGRRKAYYARAGGPAADALILILNLAQRLPLA